MNIDRWRLLAVMLVGALALAGCEEKKDSADNDDEEESDDDSKKKDKKKSDKSDKKKDKGGGGDSPKLGDSCKGMSASDGALGCDGNTVMFCSSFSEYKWTKQKDCGDGEKCTVSDDGKSASCK